MIALDQAVNIHAPIASGDIHTAVGHSGRREFVKDERQVGILGIPEQVQVQTAIGIGDELCRVAHKKPTGSDNNVGVPVRDGGPRWSNRVPSKTEVIEVGLLQLAAGL